MHRQPIVAITRWFEKNKRNVFTHDTLSPRLTLLIWIRQYKSIDLKSVFKLNRIGKMFEDILSVLVNYINTSLRGGKNNIPLSIGQSHIITAFSNMAQFPSRTRVRQTCSLCVKAIKFCDIRGKRKQIMQFCT